MSLTPEERKPDRRNPILAITGSQRPYIFDLPQLLSLPEGFEFRFRYRHTWVQRDLIRQVVAGATDFAGREAIILFHSQSSRRIVPIRRGTIIGVEELGPMILLRFRVGSFSKTELDLAQQAESNSVEEGSSTTSSVLAGLCDRAKTLLGPIDDNEHYDLSQALPPGWYLREAVRWSGSSDWDENETHRAWARLICLLQEEKTLFGVPFFFLLGFRTETGTTVTPSVIENRFSLGREPIYGFALKELERYRMRILEWCERPKNAPHPRVRIGCEFQKPHLTLEGASDLIVGRYDVVEFTFSAQQSGYSEVGLRADSVRPDEKKETRSENDLESHASPIALPAWADWPTIFAARVPVVVRPKPRKFIMAAFLFVFGLSVYIWVAPQIGPDHPTWQRLVEVGGISIALLGWRPFAEHLERFLKLSGGLDKIRGGSKGG